MSDHTPEEVVQALGNMSVMDIIALTKELEQKWGVKAEPPPMVLSALPQETQTSSSKTEFDVVLTSVPPDKKMAVVKALRDILTISLLDSKVLSESAPKTIREAVSKEEAESIQTKLTEAGATVEIK